MYTTLRVPQDGLIYIKPMRIRVTLLMKKNTYIRVYPSLQSCDRQHARITFERRNFLTGQLLSNIQFVMEKQ